MSLKPKTKTCSKCGETKRRSQFHANAASWDGLHNYCKKCNNRQAREATWRKNGIRATTAQYDRLLERQGGGCGICRRKRRPDEKQFALDHDAKTGVVRGVLCFDCNTGLGKFGDDPEQLMAAIEYLLRRFRAVA